MYSDVIHIGFIVITSSLDRHYVKTNYGHVMKTYLDGNKIIIACENGAACFSHLQEILTQEWTILLLMIGSLNMPPLSKSNKLKFIFWMLFSVPCHSSTRTTKDVCQLNLQNLSVGVSAMAAVLMIPHSIQGNVMSDNFL